MEKNIWEFYNVIRTVEETFRTLKTDPDIHPIYHKTDDGSKAHLHLAILAYWVVLCSRYHLKKAGIHHEWSKIVGILSTQGGTLPTEKICVAPGETSGKYDG
jgi:transposase